MKHTGEHGTTAYTPKGFDEKNFYDQHKIEVTDDVNGNGDEVFKGTGVKVIDRKAERHGYGPEDGKKAYDLKFGKMAPESQANEGTEHSGEELTEGEEAHAQFQKYHNDTAALLKKIHTGLSKHYANVTDKKGYNSGVAHWGHIGDIKHIHRQLQDIHDNILQQGEYAKPPQAVKAIKEGTELDERALSSGEMKKREDIVKGMKKNLSSFRAKYGKDAKSVMYATATKMAKEEVEDEFDTSLLEYWLTLNDEEKLMVSEMVEKGLDEELLEFITNGENNG